MWIQRFFRRNIVGDILWPRSGFFELEFKISLFSRPAADPDERSGFGGPSDRFLLKGTPAIEHRSENWDRP